MKKNLHIVTTSVLGTVVVLFLLGQAPMTLRSDGLQFPDGTVQTTAAAAKSFYLTSSTHDGAAAPFACAPGYHMASLWEILDPTQLRYAKDEQDAFLREDSGNGPPSTAAGWIRTGFIALDSNTNANSKGDGGSVNCAAYTSNTEGTDGTAVALIPCWQELADCNFPLSFGVDHQDQQFGWWAAFDGDCSQSQQVWCVDG